MSKRVTVLGAGVVGCATAWFLAREGANVTVVDPVGIGAGASGRNSGLIEHPYDLATEALYGETVGLLHDVLGDALVAEPAGLLLLARDEREAQAMVSRYQAFDQLEPMLLDPDQTQTAESLLAPGLWSCVLRTGYPVRPLEATSAIADLAREAGAAFRLGPGPNDGPSMSASGAEWGARVAAERLAAGDDVVLATGWVTPAVLAAVQRDRGQEVPLREDFVTGLWGVIVSVELPARPRHPLIEGALAAAHGGGEVVEEAPFTLLDSPSWLAVGSTMIEGDEPDGSEWAPRLLEHGRRFVPSIADAQVKGTLVCARPKSFDNRPILGRVPGFERLWIATGHGGRGMSTGAASARLVAEAVMSGDESAIPAALSASRLSVRS